MVEHLQGHAVDQPRAIDEYQRGRVRNLIRSFGELSARRSIPSRAART
jgi:hypothetical protein